MAATVNIGILEASALIRDEMSGALNGIRANISSFATSGAASFAALGAAGAAIAAGIGAAGAAIVALGIRGAAVSDVRAEFDGLTSSVGLSADALTSRLKEATGGVIGSFDTMVTVNRALSAGLRISVDEFGTLGEGARVLANRVGGDTKEAFDKLTEAMTTGRTKALKAYGVDVAELEQAVKNAGSGLSEYQKIEIKQKELLEQLTQATSDAGEMTLDFAERIDQGTAAVRDFMDDIGVAISESPALAVAMDGIQEAIAMAFGSDQSERIQTITKIVDAFAIMVLDAVSVVLKFADFAQKAFYGTREIIFGVLESVFKFENGLRELAIATAEYADMIPGLKGNFDGFIRSQRESQEVNAAIAASFKQTKDEAHSAAEGMSAGFAKAQTFIVDLRAKMVEASNSVTDHERVTRSIKPAVEEHAMSQKELEKQLKAAAKAAKEQEDAISQLGLVTEAMVGKQVLEWNMAIANATAGGADYARVITAIYPKLEELSKKARASGLEVAALDAQMKMFRDTMHSLIDAGFERDMDMGIDALLAAGGGIKQIDFEAVRARISADQLTGAYAAFGLKTPQELRKAADEAKRNYEILKASGRATTSDLKVAYEQMVEAQNLASGKLPGFWEKTVVPGIVNTLTTLQTAVSGSFAQMVLGAKGFGEGFTDIWKSIKASAINIFNDIAEAFIQGALKRIIGALTGAQGGISGGLGGLISKFLGGGGPVGLTGTGSSSSIAAAGLGLTGATSAAGMIGGATEMSAISQAGLGLGGTGGGGISAAVMGGVLGAAGAAAAGIGVGALAKQLMGGAGVAAGAVGGAGGAATGALIGSVVPGLGTAVGAIVGGVAGALSGFLGVSKTEKQGRSAVAEIEANLHASLSAQQQIEAGGVSWKQTLIAVRDAYMKVGLTAEEAERDVAALWASSKGGADDVARAVAPIQTAFDELARQEAAKKIAEDLEATASAAEKVLPNAAASMTDAISQQLKTAEAELQNLNAQSAKMRAEIPFDQMSVVDKEQLNQLDAAWDAQRDKVAALRKEFEALTAQGIVEVMPSGNFSEIIGSVDELSSGLVAAEVETQRLTEKVSGLRVVGDFGELIGSIGLVGDKIGSASGEADDFAQKMKDMLSSDLSEGDKEEAIKHLTQQMEEARIETERATAESGELHGEITGLRAAAPAIDGLTGSFDELMRKIRAAADENRMFRDGLGGYVEPSYDDTSAVPMATGGLVTGPMHALIGEAGPELVIPLDRLGTNGVATDDSEAINRLNSNIESFMQFLPGLLTRSIRDANRGAAVAH